jgi:hypothetical protein
MEQVSWLGLGIGLGSNLAQYVQTSVRGMFIYAETEIGRTLVEGGILGIMFVLLKIMVGVGGMLKGLQQSRKTRTVFPLLLWISIALQLVSLSIIGQLTSNGIFGVLFALGILTFRYPGLRLFH